MSVKPHASPVLHAINYLLGELSAPQLDDPARVRRPAELPEPREGPGHRSTTPPARSASAPPPRSGVRWPAATSGRFAARHRAPVLPGRRRRAGRGRLLGGDPRPDGRRARRGRAGSSTSTGSPWTGSCPTSAPPGSQGMFDAAGWQVLTVKYGRLLHELFARPGGDALRRRIDEMSNPEYQRLLRCTPDQLRERLPGTARRQARRAGRRARRRHPARRDPQPRRPRPRRAARGVRRHRRHPPDRDLRLHRQGLRPGHRGPPAEPLLAAHRRADAASWPSSVGASTGRPVGPLRRRRRPPRRCAATPPSACAARAVTPHAAARAAHRHRPHPRRAPPPPRPRSGRTLLDLTRAAPGRREARRHRQPGRLARRPTSAAG